MKKISKEPGNSGLGAHDYMKNHGLRAAMASLLMEAGHTDSSVILRPGHSNSTTIARYHSLKGGKGLRQQLKLLGHVVDSNSGHSLNRKNLNRNISERPYQMMQ